MNNYALVLRRAFTCLFVYVQDDSDLLYVSHTNKKVNERNAYCLGKIAEHPAHVFNAQNHPHAPAHSQCNLEDEVTLKVSARVRVVVNVDVPAGIFNGSLGTVMDIYGGLVAGEGTVAMDEWKVKVKLDGREEPYLFTAHTVETRDEEGRVVDWRRQLPLVLGFAVTVHKLQGASVSTKCYVDFLNISWHVQKAGKPEAFSPATLRALLYVVFSRAISSDLVTLRLFKTLDTARDSGLLRTLFNGRGAASASRALRADLEARDLLRR